MSYDVLFIAGDSLSDPGNVYATSSRLADALPFLVEPVPESPPYYQGRFSNGPVWAERLGDDLGLDGALVTNVAVGGANTDGHTAIEDVPGFVDVLGSLAGLRGLKQQVDFYLADGGEVSEDGLYVLWAGANDYLYGSPFTTASGLPSPVANLKSALGDLADAGARQFLVPNLPDLGKVPAVRGNPAEAAALSADVARHNAALETTLAAAAAAWDVRIDILDVASYFDAAYGGAFGFTSVEPCIDAPEACDSSLFFDGIHPTARAHALLGDLADGRLKLPIAPALLAPALIEQPPQADATARAWETQDVMGPALVAATALRISSEPAPWPTAPQAFLTRAADTAVTLETGDGRLLERWEGSFVYADGAVQGTVTGYGLEIDGETAVSVENAQVDAGAVFGALQGTDPYAAVELLLAGDETILGSERADPQIAGFAGDDVIDGGPGADRMVGGAGDDLYFVDDAGDVVVELAGEGTDAVFSSVHLILGVEVENLTLTGAAPLNGVGNTGANLLVGNAAANILNGNPGADRMLGAAGDDLYIVHDTGDVVVEVAGEGTDTVRSTVHRILEPEVENLTLIGAASINGVGNTGANLLVGNAGANILNGLAGADVLDGGAGNDLLIGGYGQDSLTGGDGLDLFLYASGSGRDRIEDLEPGEHIRLAGFGPDFDVADMLARASERGDDTYIDVDGLGRTDLVLAGVSDVTAATFIV